MNDDCQKLRSCCLEVRNWLVKQPSVKEESITDWLLFNVSERIDGVTYKAFTRNEEAKLTGADWEWWFIFEKYSYKMRVQAKKLKINDDNYSSLAYTNKYGMQIEKLIEDSRRENFFPFYAFYVLEAKNVKCGANILNEGVYLVGGSKLFERFILSGKKKVTSDDILSDAIPLSCFICCPICERGNNGDGFAEFLGGYFEVDSIRNNNNDLVLGQYENIPSHIESFIKYSKEGIPEWWEREFEYQIKGINSLVVYDTRK